MGTPRNTSIPVGSHSRSNPHCARATTLPSRLACSATSVGSVSGNSRGRPAVAASPMAATRRARLSMAYAVSKSMMVSVLSSLTMRKRRSSRLSTRSAGTASADPAPANDRCAARYRSRPSRTAIGSKRSDRRAGNTPPLVSAATAAASGGRVDIGARPPCTDTFAGAASGTSALSASKRARSTLSRKSCTCLGSRNRTSLFAGCTFTSTSSGGTER